MSETFYPAVNSIINVGRLTNTIKGIVTYGSVGSDASGESSVSHIDGNNIDFKHLRSGEKRPEFDGVERIFVNDLHLVGFKIQIK